VRCRGRGLLLGSFKTRTTPDRIQAGLEDWLWHSILPLIAYALLLIAGIGVRSYPREALFVVGGAALLLLFIGIHNSWDTVTYIVAERLKKPKESAEEN
jgi:energy-coupling factor transporter transmembrane protein EcfT